jgi:glycosyltransferase involved in cell wall biosynthesis
VRVLLAIGGLGRGGSETQFTRLLEHLSEPPDGVAVLVLDDRKTDNVPRIARLGVELEVIPVSRYLPEALCLARKVPSVLEAVRRFRPDVIYAWLEEAALFMVPIGRMLGIPVVVARRNVDGSSMEQRSQLVGFIQRRTERTAAIVTVNSRAVAAAARQRGIPPARIRMVPNGHEPLRPLTLPNSDELVIGYLANYRDRKGHALMLEAVSRLDGDRAWRLLFGGHGPLAEELAAQVAESGLAHRVELLDVDDPRSFWARCHVAALLSDVEGSPNALIEAAFAGRPLISTAVGGSPEIVVNGTGELVAPGDAQSAAAAIQRIMLADRGSLAAMGRRAWEHASRKFTLEAMVDGHLHALQEARELHARGGDA